MGIKRQKGDLKITDLSTDSLPKMTIEKRGMKASLSSHRCFISKTHTHTRYETLSHCVGDSRDFLWNWFLSRYELLAPKLLFYLKGCRIRAIFAHIMSQFQSTISKPKILLKLLLAITKMSILESFLIQEMPNFGKKSLKNWKSDEEAVRLDELPIGSVLFRFWQVMKFPPHSLGLFCLGLIFFRSKTIDKLMIKKGWRVLSRHMLTVKGLRLMWGNLGWKLVLIWKFVISDIWQYYTVILHL